MCCGMRRQRRQRAGLRLARIAAGVGADVALAQRAVVGDQLPVAVRGARDLPRCGTSASPPGAGAVADAAGDVTLGVDAEHGLRDVGAHRAAAAVQHHRVEDVRQRLDRVVVGAQARRRLRVAGGDHVLGRRPASRADRGPRGLRIAFTAWENTSYDERVVVDRVADGEVERAVARRAPQLQAGGGVQAHPLRVHADPRVPLLKQVLVRLEPVDLLVPVVGHVGPLGDHDAVELRGAPWAGGRRSGCCTGCRQLSTVAVLVPVIV